MSVFLVLISSVLIVLTYTRRPVVAFKDGGMHLNYLSMPRLSTLSALLTSISWRCGCGVRTGSYSCKQLSASFRADVNFFATEVYGATFLLVALSWTGFWVDPRRYGGGGAAIRLGLGLIIVLILVVYGVGFRLLHNKVCPQTILQHCWPNVVTSRDSKCCYCYLARQEVGVAGNVLTSGTVHGTCTVPARYRSGIGASVCLQRRGRYVSRFALPSFPCVCVCK